MSCTLWSRCLPACFAVCCGILPLAAQECDEYLDPKDMVSSFGPGFSTRVQDLVEYLGPPVLVWMYEDEAELFPDCEYYEIYDYGAKRFSVCNGVAYIREIILTGEEWIRFGQNIFSPRTNITELEEVFPDSYAAKYPSRDEVEKTDYEIVSISSGPCFDNCFLLKFSKGYLVSVSFYIPD